MHTHECDVDCSTRYHDTMLSPTQRYLFDTLGYIVLRGAISSSEIEAMRTALAANAHDFHEREGALRNSRGAPFVGDGKTGRRDCGRMLEWETDAHASPFRRLLAHPRVVPALHDLVGAGYRLDPRERGVKCFVHHFRTLFATFFLC